MGLRIRVVAFGLFAVSSLSKAKGKRQRAKDEGKRSCGVYRLSPFSLLKLRLAVTMLLARIAASCFASSTSALACLALSSPDAMKTGSSHDVARYRAAHAAEHDPPFALPFALCPFPFALITFLP